MKKKSVEKKNVQLINRVSGESYSVDIIGEDVIDNKPFWIVRTGPRIFKVAKDGFELQRAGKR